MGCQRCFLTRPKTSTKTFNLKYLKILPVNPLKLIFVPYTNLASNAGLMVVSQRTM